MSPASRRARVLVALAAIALAVGYAALRLDLNTEYKGASWQMLYELTAPRPYGHRVLPSLLARPLVGLGLDLYGAWAVLEIAATLGLLVALSRALRAHLGQRLSWLGAGAFLICMAWPSLLAHRWHVFYPYDTPALAFTAFGVALAVEGRFGALAALTGVAALNRETAALIPAAAFALHLGRLPFWTLVKRLIPAGLALLAARGAIFAALPNLEGEGADLWVKGKLRPLNNLEWLFALPDRPFVLLASVAWLPLAWALLHRSIPSPLGRLGWVALATATGMAVVGNLYEPRVFGEAMVLCWVPLLAGALAQAREQG